MKKTGKILEKIGKTVGGQRSGKDWKFGGGGTPNLGNSGGIKIGPGETKIFPNMACNNVIYRFKGN